VMLSACDNLVIVEGRTRLFSEMESNQVHDSDYSGALYLCGEHARQSRDVQ
jgi:hypothetical protein